MPGRNVIAEMKAQTAELKAEGALQAGEIRALRSEVKEAVKNVRRNIAAAGVAFGLLLAVLQVLIRLLE